MEARNMEPRITEPTRYLCAAVQIDEGLCDQILEEFLEEDYTVIGICHGVDIPKVLKSCLLAKKRRNKRDQRLAILLLALFLSLFNELIPLFIILYPIVWRIIFLAQRRSRYEIVGTHLLRNSVNFDFIRNLTLSQDLERKLEEISEAQNANVIIYGGFSPFVGSGFNINGWSFAVDINNGKETMAGTNTPISFQVSELYEYISDSINSLQLRNLNIEDNLYINGQEIRNERYFLPNPLMRPNTRVDDSIIQVFINQPTYSIRHYRCIRVSDWKGELILSIFLRFSKVGQSLFVEANYYLLTPLKEYYRQYDAINSNPSSGDILKLAWQSALATFALAIIYPILIPISIWSKFSKSWQIKKRKKKRQQEINSNPMFNYGAITTLRERISQEEYQRFFQKLDQEMYLKIIESKIIDGLASFLDSKNIDTSNFKEARKTILNHGIIVTGSLHAKSLAVGKRAKSIFSKISEIGSASATGND